MIKKLAILTILSTVLCSLSTVYAMGGTPPSPTQEVEIIERIATQTEEVSSREEYVSRIIAELPWGSKPGELGVKVLEGAVIGPERLVVDDTGNIYIMDTVNNRIQIYDANGKYKKSLKINSFWLEEVPGELLPRIKGSDKSIDVDVAGNIYVLDVDKKEARKINKEGQVIKRLAVPAEKKTPFEFKVDEKGSLTGKGIKTRSGLTIVFEPEAGQKNVRYVKILDQKGKEIKKVEIKSVNPEDWIYYIQFKGTDRNGNIYLQAEQETGEIRQILTSPNTYFPMKVVGSFLYRLDSVGNFVNKISISRTAKWISVDGGGNIYELKMEGEPYFSGPGAPPRKFLLLKYEIRKIT